MSFHWASRRLASSSTTDSTSDSSCWIFGYRLNYELSLPNSLPIHPVFHVSKLRKFIDSDESFPNRQQEPNRPLPEIIDEHDEYEVEAIRSHRFGKWKNTLHKQYLVKWKGYPEWENTWLSHVLFMTNLQ